MELLHTGVHFTLLEPELEDDISLLLQRRQKQWYTVLEFGSEQCQMYALLQLRGVEEVGKVGNGYA